MRFLGFTCLVFASMAHFGASPVSAQEETAKRVVAIDRPTADLLRLHSPASRLDVVVLGEHEAYRTLNGRALALRGATHVFYRSDQGSLVSQFFRERLANQGVQGIDLAERYRLRGRATSLTAEIRYSAAVQKSR